MTQIMIHNYAKALRAMLMSTVMLMSGTTVMADGEGVRIGGSVYGGGNLADVKENTEVNMGGGTVAGNVFGGGKGSDYNFTCDKAMVGTEVANNACEDPGSSTNKDKGTKVTISNGTVGTLEGEEGSQTLKEGTGNVYGGGEIGRVEWNTQVLIGVGTGEGTFAPIIYGNVFGAGKGLDTHGYSALVRGNSTVTVQGNAKVGYNVYGGGEKSTVGRYWVKAIPATPCDGETQPSAPVDLPDGMPYQQRKGGICKVTIQGNAEIGYNGAADDKGHVFGAGKGVEPSFTLGTTERMVNNATGGSLVAFADVTDESGKTKTAEELYLEFLQTLALVTNTDVTIDGSAKVKGSVYGGSESGFVQHDTNVKIQGSNCEIGTTTTYGDVFGGGRGLEEFAEAGKVKGNTEVAISAGTVNGNVYGGGELGDVGIIDKTNKNNEGQLTYNYFWKQSDGTTANTAEYNKITGTSNNTGICKVNISGGTIGAEGSLTANHASGHVFGAGKGSEETWWCEKAIAYASSVSITAGTVYGNVYGGGQVGRVEDDAKVTIGTAGASGNTAAPDIKGDVYGAGAGIETHGYSALVRGNALVTVQGTTQVGGSVYGGGEIASVGKFVVVGGLPTKPSTGGTCTVNIIDNAKIGTSGTTHHVFGACKGVTPHYNSASYKDVYSMQTYENRPDPKETPGDTWDYWVTYDQSYTGQKFIKRYYKTKDDYLAFLNTLALTSNPHVTIGGTWTANETTGTVTASSGTPSVYGSVYGGGQRGVTLGAVDVNIVGGDIHQDVYGGGALADTNLGNWDVNGYVEATGLTAGTSSVTGLYTRTGTEGNYTYTKITDVDATAADGTTYYRQEATWAHTEGSAYYKTTVDLTGGYIHGDAYGGGLGQKTGFNSATENIEATVWGDIAVTLGSNIPTPTATSFYITYDTDDQDNSVVKSGRVFGCNNLLGSPQGNVKVEVWTTADGKDGEGNTITKTPESYKSDDEDEQHKHTYRLAAVYGGGNLAPYEATGMKANVIIHGCEETSILTVYGGGNAAPVPETDVDVNSAYEIGALFGGGNGKDKYKKDSGWQINPGANVNGNANTMIYGGTVHEAYGGSNEKGTITGDVTIDVGTNVTGETCTLDVAQLVGAGKNADVNGNLKIIMGCKPSETIPLVFGGANNANVNGDVELTITSGNFGTVVGGNNAGGCIKGHIILNIEETTCIPLNIKHLYLCGYNAAYSQYGYYVKTTETEDENVNGIGATTEHAILSAVGKLQLLPRQSADDPHLPVDTYSYSINESTGEQEASWTVSPISGTGAFEPYDPPVLNVTSCTSINEVFGGGYGADATVYGNPTVNINMIPGDHASKIDRDGDGTADGIATALGEIGGKYLNENNEEVEGGVYGGGDAAAVYGNTTVNIGTETKVKLHESIDGNGVYTLSEDRDIAGAYITGNVYGGGKLADVGKTHLGKDADGKDADIIDLEGSTSVNICAVKGAEILDAQNNPTGRYNYTSVSFAEGAPGVTIGGNVYGGGKGEALPSGDGAFRCSKAMVTKHTNVAIGNGTIGDGAADHGHVYGGGEKGRVQENTSVTIGCENDANSKPVITGNVFGAGKGVNTHGYSALTRGNSYVTVQGEAKVKKSVYGGGEIASVGKYNVNAQGLPESLANQGSGYCTVIVRDNAVIGPDAAMVMTATGYPDDMGHVFGAGKGVLPYEGYADNAVAWRTKPTNDKQDYLSKNQAIAGTDESSYLTYVETLGLATQTYVTIDENAFVKGSVYGGSENGYVQHDTQVNIQGNCQIGNGYVQMDNNGVYLDKLETPEIPMGVNRPYTAAEWAAGNLIPDATKEPDLYALVHDKYYNDHSLPECASWPYGQATGDAKYAPWDTYYGTENYDSKGGRKTADDGHTFYGNVFGGGSGVIPYRPGKWHPEAGSVGGDTEVNITGGHILTSIYGGNELTDVYGKCSVNFGGTATLGVPRTLKQIAAHPVTCYLFGAGKGDQRVLFNKKTNVKDVEVNITGGWIYGSVFGGGEDGHVHHNVILNISDDTSETEHTNTKIGTWGTSYVEGNVFGGGRGFGADAYTAGNVAGTVTMNVLGGTILGSIYGGGRLGSVGYGLFDEGVAGYGEMRPDGEGEDGNPTPATNFLRGHVYMTIGNNDGTGPTIGNIYEYKIPSASNGPMTTGETPAPTLPENIKNWTEANWTTWREHNHVPKTEYEYNESKGYYMLKHTKGGNVFTGGMGNFYRQDGSTLISGVDWWKLGCVKSTTLTIKGGTIKSNVYGGGELGQVTGHHTTQNANYGTEITIQGSSTTIGTEIDDGSTVQYTFGSVFGGGYGSLMEKIEVQRGTGTPKITSYPKFIAGFVKEDTKIDMQGGAVKASIYGGGEMASVGENTTSGETTTATGSTHVSVSGGTVGIAPITVSGSKRYFGGAKMGNVYGGGSGHNNTVRSGKIFNNTNVTISGGTIYHNIYGGGAYGTVGDFDYDTGNDGKVTGVKKLLTSGTGVATVTITGGTIGYDGKENGMVFGSSRGDINQPRERDDHTAWVYDTHVTIGTAGTPASGTEGEPGYVAATPATGPSIKGTVYGSGENGHVFNNTVVTINGGTIGIDDSNDPGYRVTSNNKTYEGAAYPYRGNVYGGGCGTDKYYQNHSEETHDGEGQLYNSLAGIVYGNSTINITGGHVVRNVYGAGAMGSVGKVTTTAGVTTITDGGLTTINISGGIIGVDGDENGNVFGAARGDKTTTQTDCALVQTTDVNISGTADIKGSVYGGGETGDVHENTEVNVCAEKQTSNNVVSYVAASGTPTIAGNVYGGGKGVANSFECAKAMVGIVNQGVTETVEGEGENAITTYTLRPGGTTVRIYNGTVGTLVGEVGSQTLKAGTGNVYGGGEIARVERNTAVEIGAATGTSAPVIRGSVFAAGAGKETHGYSALVRGHSTVTVQGSAQVFKNVFGGGEKASVGRYKVKTPLNAGDKDVPATLPLGMPAHLLAGGTSTVNIQGSAVIGTAGNASTGHVYGAGQGVVPSWTYTEYTSDTTPYTTRITNSKRMVNYTSETTHPSDKQYKEWDYYEDENGKKDTRYVWEYFTTKDAYLEFIESLALSAETYVTIGGKRNETTGVSTPSGTPTINGSVFGGSESGFVYRNTDVKIQGGTVEGDAFGGGRGLISFAEAGRVRWNTKLAISGDGTIVKGNVYGGGNMGDVGTIYKDEKDSNGDLTYNYVWKTTDANGNNLDADASHVNALGNNTVAAATNKNTGICTVDISGGTIGLASTNEPTRHGNVFGAGEGSWQTWWCEKAIVYATDVSVKGGTVYGNVYGGGEVGRVEDDAKVTIGTSEETGANKPNITGSVFGGGAGLQTHGYSALVRGDSKVTVQGASKVGGNVYGGGEIASVGRFKVVGGLPSKPKGGGTCTVVVKDNAVTGDVYGSCKGVTPNYVESGTNRSKSMQLEKYKGTGAEGTDWDYFDSEHKFVWVYYTTKNAYLAFLPTLGLASNTHVTIGGNSTVNGSVFGGGQRGITLGGVDVNITGGTVSQDVYGGGALANSNSSHWHEGHRTDYVELDELYKGIPLNGYYSKSGDTYTLIDDGSTADGVASTKYYAIFKTNVNLKGGTVNHNVYGGGLGQLAKAEVAGHAAVLYTDVDEYNTAKGTSLTADEFDALSDAEKTKTPAVAAQAAEDAIEAKVYGDVSVVLNKPTNPEDDTTYGDCEVKGTIFGCNNLNGSPQAGVDVHVYKTVAKENGSVKEKPAKTNTTYEMTAVYGGGNLAAYYPDDETMRAKAMAYVTIDGCDKTSIGSVYGGGNAASAPATEVVVNGTWEIGEAFGGGNGKDDVSYDGTHYVTNPGANVGLRAYPDANNLAYATKQERDTNYGYGSGKSHITIYGGTVHSVYGGSNKRGNVRVESRTTLEDRGCNFNVGEAYGGGNNAPQDGDAVLEIGCISGMDKAYGGASNADVNGDVVLNITNGTYGRVFGGNDLGGLIRGSITVNIEETGCRPIIIGELYGGGNLARYSVYGYNDDGSVKETGDNPVPDPVVNVKSFTSIGNIYGGGYGKPALMVGSPEVNINVLKGKYAETYKGSPNVIGDNARIVGSTVKYEASDTGYDSGYPIPSHAAGAIGAINNVFGGGNAANVIGTPHVNVGTLTGEVISLMTKPIEDSEGKDPSDADWIPSYELTTAEGIDIRGNVFGGGNNADVTGDTEVVIGKNNTVKTYSFTSYGSKSGNDVWSSGLAQTTGATETISNEKYAEVVILTNGKYGEFVGKKFYVDPKGTGRLQLYDANKVATLLWVDIKPFEQKTYTFTSYSAQTEGTTYSTDGTATATGNFKIFSGQEYMQIVVLTNPGHDEWVGRTFYVPVNATTDGNTRCQLYNAKGETESVWVTIK